MILYDQIFPSDILAVTTEREMDFKLTDDACCFNRAQQDWLEDHFHFSDVAHIRQVHGDKTVVIKESDQLNNQVIDQTDSLVTNIARKPLAIRTADCLPVFLYDPQNKAIALIHAGWQSSKQHISAKAIEKMRVSFGSHHDDLKVAFGPAIKDCCCEVTEEFLDYFPGEEEICRKDGKLYLDLFQVNRNQLTGTGVKDDNIFDCRQCTVCDERYFSFRGEGDVSGRMLSVIMIKG